MEARTVNPCSSKLQMCLAPEQLHYELQQQQLQHHNLITPPGMHDMPSSPGWHLDQHFYLNEPSPPPSRTWGQPMSPQGPTVDYQLPDGYRMPPQQPRRAQWGTPHPVSSIERDVLSCMDPNIIINRENRLISTRKDIPSSRHSSPTCINNRSTPVTLRLQTKGLSNCNPSLQPSFLSLTVELWARDLLKLHQPKQRLQVDPVQWHKRQRNIAAATVASTLRR